MADRPILFRAPMVRAILAGTKTQTRRVCKPAPVADTRFAGGHYFPGRHKGKADISIEAPYVSLACRHGQPGDRLWVRETWMDLQGTGVQVSTGDRSRYAYGADTPPGSYGDECRKDLGLKWRPSIHMPRAASRITLEITGVRVERLQDISVADAMAEGVAETKPHMRGLEPCMEWRYAYEDLWTSINGPGSWDANPWVWVLTFQRADARTGDPS